MAQQGKINFKNRIEILVYLKFHSSEIHRHPIKAEMKIALFGFKTLFPFSFETNGFDNLGKSNINYVMAWAFKCEFKTVLTPICVAALAHLVWPKFVMQIRPVVWSHFHFIHIYSPGAALKSHDCRQTLT